MEQLIKRHSKRIDKEYEADLETPWIVYLPTGKGQKPRRMRLGRFKRLAHPYKDGWLMGSYHVKTENVKVIPDAVAEQLEELDEQYHDLLDHINQLLGYAFRDGRRSDA